MLCIWKSLVYRQPIDRERLWYEIMRVAKALLVLVRTCWEDLYSTNDIPSRLSGKSSTGDIAWIRLRVTSLKPRNQLCKFCADVFVRAFSFIVFATWHVFVHVRGSFWICICECLCQRISKSASTCWYSISQIFTGWLAACGSAGCAHGIPHFS